MSDIDKFYSTTTETAGGCLRWTGAFFAEGPRPRFYSAEGGSSYAHRWIWETTHGPLPVGHCLKKRCGNMWCVNEAHMVQSTEGKPRATWQERFLEKVDRKSEQECWPWQAGFFSDGYGAFWYEKKLRKSHRMAWLLEHGGTIDPKDIVRHFCDNPACCNPAHLELGTVQDNNDDRTTRGRSRASWNIEDAAEIRKKFLALPKGPSGKTIKNGHLKRLAEEYGVSSASIRTAATGALWRLQ